GSPLIAGGRVFVPIARTDGALQVVAVDAHDGEVEWVRPEETAANEANVTIAYDNGHLFVLQMSGRLESLDAATGDLVWGRKIGPQWQFDTPPAATGGRLFVVGAGYGATVSAINEATGEVEWSSRFYGSVESAATVTESDVFVSGPCHNAA